MLSVDPSMLEVETEMEGSGVTVRPPTATKCRPQVAKVSSPEATQRAPAAAQLAMGHEARWSTSATARTCIGHRQQRRAMQRRPVRESAFMPATCVSTSPMPTTAPPAAACMRSPAKAMAKPQVAAVIATRSAAPTTDGVVADLHRPLIGADGQEVRGPNACRGAGTSQQQPAQALVCRLQSRAYARVCSAVGPPQPRSGRQTGPPASRPRQVLAGTRNTRTPGIYMQNQ